MANSSILAAFERMWQHVVVALDNKSDLNHGHEVLTIKGNGTTIDGGTYDGSSASTVNITPESIGAASVDDISTSNVLATAVVTE